MTNTIPHDHHHHHQGMDRLQALAVKPQAKKQSRRRTHTSRPYQERLLNMAEARREIVTALKIHRATTTSRQQQQSTYQHHQEPPLQVQQQQEEQQQQQVQAVAFHDRSRSQAAAVDEEEPLSSHTTATSYAAASFCNPPLCNYSPLQHWIAAAGSYCSPPVVPPCDLTPPELAPTAAMDGGLAELEHYQYQGSLECLVRSLSLPAQPLGLNLSFHGFGVSVDDGGAAAKDDDCEEDLFGSRLPLVAQPSPPAASYSYSPPAPAVETTTATTHTHAYGHGSPAALSAAAGAENHHPVVNDAPAAQPALIPVVPANEQDPIGGGEMQGVEAAAAADVAAWWSKIFEGGQRATSSSPDAEDVAPAATTAAGLPAEWRWLCGDEDIAGGAAEQGAVTAGGVLATMVHVGDDGDYSCCYEGGRSDVDGEDVTLPCMDGIGDDDVQGWDGEWFSCS